MNNPLVSIITPCYNDGKYLMECVQCVREVSYSNIEHIIIDDGSTDLATLSIIEELKKASDLKIIITENQGVCRAKQKAINESSGKYILPLDADDLISKEFINLAVCELEKDNEVSLVVTDYKYFGKRRDIIRLEEYSLSRLLGRNLFVNSSIFRKEDFIRAGGYNENMKEGFEDWDLWINLLKREGKVKKVNNIHFFYRIKKRKESRNASIDSDRFSRLRKNIWINHQELYSKIYVDPKDMFEFVSINNSLEYRIVKFLLKPIRNFIGY